MHKQSSRSSLPCPRVAKRFLVLHVNVGPPDFVHILSHVQDMSRVCPTFGSIWSLVLSSTNSCLQIPTFVLVRASICPHFPLFVLFLPSVLNKTSGKTTRQKLFIIWTCYLFNLPPSHPAAGHKFVQKVSSFIGQSLVHDVIILPGLVYDLNGQEVFYGWVAGRGPWPMAHFFVGHS